MKRIALMTLIGCIALSLNAFGQCRDEASVSFDGKTVVIDYGCPSLNGRDMLSRLSPGMAWRMGQNAATTLNTAIALTFGDKKVEPGNYGLWSRKNDQGQWFLIVSSKTNPSYSSLNDVAVIPLATHDQPSPVETFTIELEKGSGNSGVFVMMWGTLKVTADFTAG